MCQTYYSLLRQETTELKSKNPYSFPAVIKACPGNTMQLPPASHCPL